MTKQKILFKPYLTIFGSMLITSPFAYMTIATNPYALLITTVVGLTLSVAGFLMYNYLEFGHTLKFRDTVRNSDISKLNDRIKRLKSDIEIGGPIT